MTAVEQLRERITAHAIELARLAADMAVEETKAAASRDRGGLIEGIHHTEPVLTGSLVVCEIRSEATYSEAQDEGSGIYGPTGLRIFPKHGKVLAFSWPGNIRAQVSRGNPEGLSFFASVAGSPGKHFFREPMPGRWREALAANASNR